jgi:hypothetical protein
LLLDATDNSNRFSYVDRTGQKRTTTLNANPNWDGDRTDPPYENPVQANIDTSGAAGPAACANTTNTSQLNGFHDWNAVSLSPRGLGGGAGNTEPEPSPNEEEMDRMLNGLNKADLAVTIADSPDPVGAGEMLCNLGELPGSARSYTIRAAVPADLVYRAGRRDRCWAPDRPGHRDGDVRAVARPGGQG